MKKYEEAQRLGRRQFRRLTGVYPETYAEMVEVLRAREAAKKKSGRPAALLIEDQLLMTLEFWRKYPTLFHLGYRWGMTESSAQRTVTRAPDALIQSGQFTLPGKRALCDDTVSSVVVVDVSEAPCERPQKNSGRTTARKRSSHAENSGGHPRRDLGDPVYGDG